MRAPARYALTMVTVAAAVVATNSFRELLEPMRMFFFWCAVLVTALLGGVRPALVAVLLSIGGAAFFVFEPSGAMGVRTWLDVVRLALFALFAGGIAFAVGLRRRAELRAGRLGADLHANELR